MADLHTPKHHTMTIIQNIYLLIQPLISLMNCLRRINRDCIYNCIKTYMAMTLDANNTYTMLHRSVVQFIIQYTRGHCSST